MFEPPSGTRTTLGRHHTPASDVDALAAGRLTAGTAHRIRAVERGRRMLMVRAVVETARECAVDAGPPLPSMDIALDLLLRVEQARPDVVVDLLEHPGTGIWAVRVLERLHAGDKVPHEGRDGLPLWAELGYLHCLAAAAALRSGTEGTIRLPVREGCVALPTLGRIRLPAATDHDRARTPAVATLRVPRAGSGPAVLAAGEHRLSLPADPGRPSSDWQPVRRAAWAPERSAPSLVLEDCDPYRDFRAQTLPSSSVSLSGGQAERWQQLLGEAGKLLSARHPQATELLAAALRVVVPLPPAPRFRTASASYSEAFGSALISLPPDPVELAVTMVHETRHSVLNGLLHQLPLCDTDSPGAEDPLFYAPWRGDPRPLSGVLHGAYAFAGVTEFWRVERRALSGPAADLAHFEYAVWHTAVGEALATLRTSPGLTEAGRQFVERMAETADAWPYEPVPEWPGELARAEGADLRAVWRARHTRPDPGQVRVLTEAWRSGADPGTAPGVRSRLRPDPRGGLPDARAELRRVRLAEPETLLARVRADEDASSRPLALVAADVALLLGDAARSVRGYLDVLTEYPGLPSAWAGLGLALSAAGRPTAAHALLRRPEVVRAVHWQTHERYGVSPDPVEVADWIGRNPAVCDAS
ncbi:HEXXH motif domain-containing protein [Streptomyces aurantiacus]|uniref:HEXXH motif domain-containing protein n=1 Tax=Streptomyces aurantiacus TaxID=47760 RepID=UPI0006E254CB|nr:HEXXH motif domain-containing protein [Streptomyces aurantiacus]